MRNRPLVGIALSVLGLALAAGTPRAEGPAPVEIEVYRTPTCGCCGKWVDHLRGAGFRVAVHNLDDLSAVKAAYRVPRELASCHTGLVDGYVVEGHVPASDIRRLLRERPEVRGIAVPKMPLGSPGMEHPDPRRHQPYSVLAFGDDGVSVFARHRP